jgi:hypothetical protein
MILLSQRICGLLSGTFWRFFFVFLFDLRLLSHFLRFLMSLQMPAMNMRMMMNSANSILMVPPREEKIGFCRHTYNVFRTPALFNQKKFRW